MKHRTSDYLFIKTLGNALIDIYRQHYGLQYLSCFPFFINVYISPKLEHLPVDYTQCNNMNNTTNTMNMHFHHNTLTHKLIFVAEIQSHTKDLTIAIQHN